MYALCNGPTIDHQLDVAVIGQSSTDGVCCVEVRGISTQHTALKHVQAL